jgi:hypothetical protein
MVRLGRHETRQIIEVIQRVPGHMLSVYELGAAEHRCQLGTGERAVQDQFSLARSEADSTF